MPIIRSVLLKGQRTSRALAVLCFLAATFAMQPCAMALDAGPAEHDCPHCPPADTHHEMPCDTAVEPGCGGLEQLKHDGRPVHSQLKDTAAVLPWPMPAVSRPQTIRPFKPPPLTHHPGAPPLGLLFCVDLN